MRRVVNNIPGLQSAQTCKTRMSRLSPYYCGEAKNNGVSISPSELKINKGVSAFLTNNDADDQEGPETGQCKPGNFFCDL